LGFLPTFLSLPANRIFRIRWSTRPRPLRAPIWWFPGWIQAERGESFMEPLSWRWMESTRSCLVRLTVSYSSWGPKAALLITRLCDRKPMGLESATSIQDIKWPPFPF
jgi:hypothetical protein